MRFRETRYPCDTELTVSKDNVARRARLINVSATGGRIEGVGKLPAGMVVTLSHLNARILARVVWSTEKQTALQFREPLTPAGLSALRREGSRGPTGGGFGGGWTPPGGQGFRELT